MVVKKDWISLLGPDGANEFAARLVAEFANREVADIPISVEGRTDLWPFIVVRPNLAHLTSDITIKLHHLLLRIMSAEHVWDFTREAPNDYAVNMDVRQLNELHV